MRNLLLNIFLSGMVIINFLGCGGGESSVKTSILSKPIATGDSSGNIVVSGTLSLDSMMSNLQGINSVVLTGLNFTLPAGSGCKVISDNLPTNLDVTSDNLIDFKITISGECYALDEVKLNGIKTTKYNNGVSQNDNFIYDVKYDNTALLSIYNSANIKVNNPSNITTQETNTLTYQILKNTAQLQDIDVREVDIQTLDSSKIVLIDDKGNEVNNLTYTSLPYKQFIIKGKDSGQGNVKITVIADIDNETIKKSQIISFNINSINYANKYNVNLSLNDSFSIDQKESIGISIVKQDDNLTYIDDTNINNVTVTFEKKLISFASNSDIFTYSYSKNARNNIDVYTKTIAGVDTIHIDANIFDGEKNVDIQSDYPITIIGGSPSSISIVYKDTSFESPFFYDTYVVHAVDKYGNPAKEGSTIYLGAVNALDKDVNGDELYVENGGKISRGLDSALFSLTDASFDFSNVAYHDSVVVLSQENKMNPLYLGGWIVDDIENNSTLKFSKPYNGEDTDGLTFVVGNEKRYDICEKQVKLIDFDSDDNTYTLNTGGMKEIRLRYPSYMVGKDVYLYVNSYDENRTGVSIRKKLWGNGIDSKVDATACTVGSNCNIDILFTLKSSNAPLENEDFSLDNFTISNGCTNATLVKSNTKCDGAITINVNYADGCSIKWNGNLMFEH